MSFGCETIIDFDAGREAIGRWRYGVIKTSGSELSAIHLRPWPALLSLRDLWPVGDDYHAHGPADHCWLYYNQPWRTPNFLALKYIVSTHGTNYATFWARLQS